MAAGRLEMDYYGVRGNVCATDLDTNSANVLCRKLRYQSSLAYSPWTKESNTSFSISMKCSGLETSPDQCGQLSINQVVKCQHGSIVGLVCKKKTGEY